jgi:hypothetical protein
MDTPLPPEVITKAIRKTLAAIEGMGHKAVAMGPVACQAWGSRIPAQSVDLLTSSNATQRDSILGAARGEGLQQVTGKPLGLRYADAKLNAAVEVSIVEASTPVHKRILERAQRLPVSQVQMFLAPAEELIIALAATPDREALVELLRAAAARIDGAALKRDAEAAGVFDKVKAAWQEARQKA